MNTINDEEAKNTTQEIQALKERIAFLEGRRDGSARILNIVIPLAIALLAIMSFATLSARINAAVDSGITRIMESQIEDRVNSEEFKNLILAEIEEAIQRAEKAALNAEQAKDDLQVAVEQAEDAASKSEASATLTAKEAGDAEESADQAEQAADQAEVVVKEVVNGNSPTSTPETESPE